MKSGTGERRLTLLRRSRTLSVLLPLLIGLIETFREKNDFLQSIGCVHGGHVGGGKL